MVSTVTQRAIEHDGQHAAGAGVEGGLVLVEDRGREGGEAQHREHAELGEQVQRDEQAAAEHRGPQLGQDDAGEGAPRPQAQRAGGVLPRPVEPAQGGRHGQEDQREVRQRRDQHGATEPGHRRAQRHPGVGVDEGGHRQRCDQQHAPPAGPGQAACARPARRRRRPARRRRRSRRRPATPCCAAAHHTRGRSTSATASDQPWPSALTSTTTIGSTDTAVTSTAASHQRSAGRGDGCRRGAGPVGRPRVVVRHGLDDACLGHQLDHRGAVKGERVDRRGLQRGQRRQGGVGGLVLPRRRTPWTCWRRWRPGPSGW